MFYHVRLYRRSRIKSISLGYRHITTIMTFDKSWVQAYTLSHHTISTRLFVPSAVQANTSTVVPNIPIEYNPCQEWIVCSWHSTYYPCNHTIQCLLLFSCRTIVGHVTLISTYWIISYFCSAFHFSLVSSEPRCIMLLQYNHKAYSKFLYAISNNDITYQVG